MKHKKSLALYHYWNRLRGNGAAPERSAIDPKAISSLLGDLFILERKSQHEYPFRLAGTRLCSAYGMELRKHNMAAFFTGSDRSNFENILHTITEEAAPAIIGIQAENTRGRSLPLELIMLPLRQNDGRMNRIIGGLMPLESAYWIGVDPLIRQTIRSMRLIRPDDMPEDMSGDDDNKPRETFGRSIARRSAMSLRVIEGGLSKM